MSKRESQTIFKGRARQSPELETRGNSSPSQAVGTKTGFFSKATSSRSRSERPLVLNGLPAGRGRRSSPVRYYFRTE
jgi:hypothetical protein